MSEKKQKPSRREFLYAAAALGGAMFAGSLAACSPQGRSADGESMKSEAGGASPAAQEYQVSDRLSCDVVVVGGGISGLSAAVEAAQQGGSVILVEKQSKVGGNSRFAEGPFAVNSPMQKEAGIEVPLYEALKNELDFSNYRSNSAVWLGFLKSSGENIGWMLDNGVKFSEVRKINAGLEGWHMYEGGGTAAVDVMLAKAQELGVQVLTETPMVQVTGEGGSATGIIVEGPKGTYTAIESGGVILASGGTGANTETLSERTGFDCSKARIDCNPGNTGDGIEQSVLLGAGTRKACIMGDKVVAGWGLFDHISFATTRQPVLWVNDQGERFVNEEIQVQDIPSAFNAVFIGQDSSFSVLDQATLDRFATGDCPVKPADFAPLGESSLPKLQEQVDKAVAAADDSVFKGNSVRELAEAMGVPAESMQTTVDSYNASCATGEDSDFFKNNEFLMPVEKGPFYAFRMAPLVVCAIGGLNTNTKNQVLDQNKNPIPNLYAVGLDGCNLYEETYNMMLGGSANGYCIHSGRNAARNALGKN